ncbi:hypothetical protein Cgig2_016552 [Carnegiea gigantea]|uniref:DUF4283 domain-containing protein n=1 Tax=Carnegiea gigantea TaxID=171969 RepID=A0A9Q1L047_9CARY|nr:hypothetical protein Cgig2_016552 [Carnegiea gigantea]
MGTSFSQSIYALRRRRQSTSWVNKVEQTEHTEGTDSIAPNFGSSSVACFMLGANPPVQVMEGFFYRLWGNKGYEKTVAKPDGAFIMRFYSVLERDAILKNSFKKPLIIRPWVLGQTIDKNDVARIPVWTTFQELDFKYWSKEGLSKIGILIGKPIATDKATQAKLRTKFARLLIKMDLNDPFPKEVTFMDECGTLVVQKEDYA